MQTQSHFFAVASHLFLRILVDHARKRERCKRSGGADRVVLDERFDITEQRGLDLLRLEDALKTLARMSKRQSRVVELKFFWGT